MSDKKSVNIALERYFATLTSQISAGDQLKNAVNDLLAKKENPEFQNTGNANKIDEWDVLDQSYISIKLQNAFSEIENRAVVLKGNVTKLHKNERDVSWFETSPEEVNMIGNAHFFIRNLSWASVLEGFSQRGFL